MTLKEPPPDEHASKRVYSFIEGQTRQSLDLQINETQKWAGKKQLKSSLKGHLKATRHPNVDVLKQVLMVHLYETRFIRMFFFSNETII